MADWEVSDELWARIKPLLPMVQRRRRYPGRRRLRPPKPQPRMLGRGPSRTARS
ncbi:MAG TPA: IS5/IS1182 family transposase, partial [Actinomycetes bacterium]|nr:IS5/IS1182 family transposase [Actinomycetes bacterium]